MNDVISNELRLPPLSTKLSQNISDFHNGSIIHATSTVSKLTLVSQMNVGAPLIKTFETALGDPSTTISDISKSPAETHDSEAVAKEEKIKQRLGQYISNTLSSLKSAKKSYEKIKEDVKQLKDKLIKVIRGEEKLFSFTAEDLKLLAKYPQKLINVTSKAINTATQKGLKGLVKEMPTLFKEIKAPTAKIIKTFTPTVYVAYKILQKGAKELGEIGAEASAKLAKIMAKYPLKSFKMVGFLSEDMLKSLPKLAKMLPKLGLELGELGVKAGGKIGTLGAKVGSQLLHFIPAVDIITGLLTIAKGGFEGLQAIYYKTKGAMLIATGRIKEGGRYILKATYKELDGILAGLEGGLSVASGLVEVPGTVLGGAGGTLVEPGGGTAAGAGLGALPGLPLSLASALVGMVRIAGGFAYDSLETYLDIKDMKDTKRKA